MVLQEFPQPGEMVKNRRQDRSPGLGCPPETAATHQCGRHHANNEDEAWAAQRAAQRAAAKKAAALKAAAEKAAADKAAADKAAADRAAAIRLR